MGIVVIGLLMLAFLDVDTSETYIITALAILGFGFGLFSSPNTNMIMSSVDKRFYGVANATVSTMRSTGMMFSMAIASLVVNVFVGKQQINDLNILSFIHGSNLIFSVFTFLCLIGVFFSFIGKKRSDSM
jgi:MFS family permease